MGDMGKTVVTFLVTMVAVLIALWIDRQISKA